MDGLAQIHCCLRVLAVRPRQQCGVRVLREGGCGVTEGVEESFWCLTVKLGPTDTQPTAAKVCLKGLAAQLILDPPLPHPKHTLILASVTSHTSPCLSHCPSPSHTTTAIQSAPVCTRSRPAWHNSSTDSFQPNACEGLRAEQLITYILVVVVVELVCQPY